MKAYFLDTIRLMGIALLGCSCAIACYAESTKPDFSGIYLFYGGRMAAFGLGRDPLSTLPLNPEARAKVEEVQKVLEGTGETSGAWCLGEGMPGSMMLSGGYPMEIIQRPEQVTIIYELHSEIRRIYIGDSKQMAAEDKIPDRNGYSKGWWEGNELVVETTHLKEQLDGRYPHSDAATTLERYRFEEEGDKKILVADLVVTDPKFYIEPYKVQKKWEPDNNTFMFPYECFEPHWLERIEEIRQLKKEGKEIPVR